MYIAQKPRTSLRTHTVENQPQPLADYNLFTTDPALLEAAKVYGPCENAALAKAGAAMGSKTAIEQGFAANKYPPELTPYDRYGQRVDEVAYHPAYHALMALGKTHGVHSAAWTQPKAGHVTHAALEYMLIQTEAGVCCPLTMTYAATPTLRKNPALAKLWEDKILNNTYDPSPRPVTEKKSATIGMAMTEKQGGSDVRANTTQAKYIGSCAWGEEYALTGHKWFCSAPMSDGFLTLAQTKQGLTCFFVPRWRPTQNGQYERNVFEIQRLKDKLGNRSNASAEIHYDGTFAVCVGEKGQGVPTIIEMVNHTRLDCAVGSAGLMRQAVVQALHHTSQRTAFGKRLAEQPPMQNLLADMLVEAEAATHLALRVAQAFDKAPNNKTEAAFARLAVSVAKFWVTKRLPNLTYEAMECLGGNGYIEDFITPRLYREAPVNSIWEGTGNVICLDVLRTLQKEPQAIAAYFAEVEKAKGQHHALDAHIADLKQTAQSFDESQLGQVRPFTEKLAVTLQAALLLQHAPVHIAHAFCETRLAHNWGHTYGTLPATIDPQPIICRHLEALTK